MTASLHFYGDGVTKGKGGIKFKPKKLVFSNDDSIKELSLTNISWTDKIPAISVKVLELQNGPFKVKELRAAVFVEYNSSSNATDKNEKVAVTVDGKVTNIPVQIDQNEPFELDFGCIIANGKTIVQEISLFNHGSKSEEFKITYGGGQPIEILPTCGSVPPNSEKLIKVRLKTKHAGNIEQKKQIEEKVKVTHGHETKFLYVRANLVETEGVLSQGTEEMPCSLTTESDTNQVCSENFDIDELPENAEEPDRLKQRARERRKCCVISSVVMIGVAVVATVATVLGVYFTEGF